ncbi:PREDICTED: ovostatin-like [Chrysochloris asiatica]|uniref:Ovostatin-like n=1 Tax=Chrysochloris asiatica TaxID=185453 RepID=A0A9B0U4C9_CHRAS|nr:PREDICTED: ovostatin-like [Chrysochloris asiatica]
MSSSIALHVIGLWQYVLLVPSVLQEGSLDKVCAQLFNLTETVVLHVSINSGEVQTIIFEEEVTGENFFKCLNFEVPKAGSDPLAFITFSAKGATLDLHERRSVAIQHTENVVFVQMDKQIYKPGERVRFRIVALNNLLKPVKQMYPVIALQDPHGNRIQQWDNEESFVGLVQLSFQLTSEPILGWYSVTVETPSGEKAYQTFSVEEYVLPKFQMTVDAPENVLVVDPEFRVKVCALYTYGKAVEGKVQLQVCRAPPYIYGSCKFPLQSLCVNFTTQLEKTGCVSNLVSTNAFELYREGYRSYLEVHVRVTEHGTGVQLTDSKYINIDSAMVRIQFENMDTVYKQGIPYVGQIKLLRPDKTPISNEVVHLHLKDKIVGNYTTDVHGTAQFSLDTSKMTYPNITLKVISKGAIILYGQKKIIKLNNDASVFTDMKGMFSIPIEANIELAPSALMLVYTLHPGGEMIADSTHFEIEKCFQNEVNLNFSKDVNLPGSNTSLQISAASNSLCALLAIDESVLLLRNYDQLSAQTVYNKLRYRQLYGYYFKGFNLEDGPRDPCLQQEEILHNGIYYAPEWADFGKDAYDLVKAMGLKVFTNSHHRKPVLCKNIRHPGYDVENISPTISSDSAAYTKDFAELDSSRSYTDTLRKSFPETWVWNLITTDSTGKASLPLTVPDTITQWKANGFCLNDKAGFGISPTISLTAFQPFFVDLTLPYSVVRGEAFILKANVFNYLNRCTQINTVLKSSNAYQARLLPTEDKNVCICGSEKKSYSWLVTPQTLGTINLTVVAETLQASPCEKGSSRSLNTGWRDTLIKPLLVEPEGIGKELTQGSLVCTNGSTVSQSVVLASPENLVNGSSRAYWSVLGDILGSAMQNLQNLLQMPFGCGEQNMALFTPNIYILDYLSQTQQLTEEIKSKAIGYLTKGYQKQLSYKLSDGSYSTFGHEVQQGNTWLTAFVYKSFAQSKRYIYIDDKVQSQTLTWLVNNQKSDGCFLHFGNVFNNALKGEEDDKISLTAYVINALIEAGHPISFVAIQKGLQCIEAAFRNRATTTYEQALLAYTFSIAGHEDKREFLIGKLSKKAKKVGGSLYWELEKQRSLAEPSSFYYPWASSAEIEVTCYVLLAILSKPQLTSEELSYASHIVQWLAKQQNSRGGFSSTKDTVVALQALTLFQSLTFSKSRQNSALIFSDQAFYMGFHVNNENRLLLQQIPLPTTNSNYKVEVNGYGCVYVQVEVSYLGRRNSSNMAIIDVKMLSGFVPDKSSIEKLQRDGKVQRVESKASHVFFYLENVTQKEIKFSFSVEQDALVANLRPASIQLYDYYETDEYALAEYNTPCDQMSFESSWF